MKQHNYALFCDSLGLWDTEIPKLSAGKIVQYVISLPYDETNQWSDSLTLNIVFAFAFV